MKIYHGFADPTLKKAGRSIAIGIFDGVHRGHRLILQKALRASKALHVRSMVVTFHPHPQTVLSGTKASTKILMSLDHRIRLFSEMGIQETLVVVFDKKFAAISHEDFLNKRLIEKLGMRALSVGHDFRFGRFAKGDRHYLSKEAAARGFKLLLTKEFHYRGQAVSSTRIRYLIERGDLIRARELLGRPVSLHGTVVRGHGRGRSIGFPTANLDPHHETLPPAGVYAALGVIVKSGDKRTKISLPSVVHIGERPTFNEKEKTVEVHFLDFKGNLYGKEIEMSFLSRIRGIRHFTSKEHLSRQIATDILTAKKFL